MPETWIDPARLEGNALRQWYLRSPADLEPERQEAASLRYKNFFHPQSGAGPHQRFRPDSLGSSQDIDPRFSLPFTARDLDPGFARVAASPNTWSNMRMAATAPSFSTTSLLNVDGAQRPATTQPPPPSTKPPFTGAQQLGSAPPAQSTQKPAIDPSTTPVFQTGPEGKLHPIPGWHTTGPFDFKIWSHNIHWGGVAKDLGKIAAGIPAFFSGIGMAEGLLSALGPATETAVADGIADISAAKAAAKAFHDHHPEPKYMGGPKNQELVRIEDELHRRFHNMLARAQREAGFPRVGGRGGSKAVWDDHFDRNPGSRDKAMEILRRISQEFDEAYGTNINSKLPPAPNPGGIGTPPPID